jgi:glutamate-ammonia-ligase adenylyltransferase
VHFVQLRDRAGFGPDLAAAIAALGDRLPPGLAAAHATLTRFLVLLRLAAPGASVPAGFAPAVEAMLARGMGAANFADAVQELTLAKAAVRLAFNQLLTARGAES